MKPFFSIITRTFPGRAPLLARCEASVEAQTFKSVEHLILRDEVGAGIAAAQLMMHTAAPKGEYVFVLDDDDYLSDDSVLESLQDVLQITQPSFAVVKVQHGMLGTMPLVWGGRPTIGTITVSNVVCSHLLWYLKRKNFTPEYAGDYAFVKSLFDEETPLWVDLPLVTVETMRHGQTERHPA